MKTLLRPVLLSLALTLTAPALAQTKPADAKPESGLPADLFLKTPPAAAALSPEQAKKTVKQGDTITLVGRVGGSKSPFVAGRSILTLVGDMLPACSDNPDDHCKVPWDYCCETKADIARHSATIQLVDDKGKTLRVDLKGQGGITELAALTVVGAVAQVSDKALVVNAKNIYINPALPHGFFLTKKPADAKPVEEVKPTAKPGDTVTITGRIGKSADAIHASKAEFTLLGSDDQAATIQVVDDKANPPVPLALNLHGRGHLAPGSTVTVTGKVIQSENGTLVIAARGVHAETGTSPASQHR